jgi:hypothetical protein
MMGNELGRDELKEERKGKKRGGERKLKKK